jgi:hypothetical protein
MVSAAPVAGRATTNPLHGYPVRVTEIRNTGEAPRPPLVYHRCVLRLMRQLKEVNTVIRWQIRLGRALLVMGAFVALAVSAGAGARW